MKIYTRTGDKGETGLYRGGRISKDDPRIQACGAVDELNSCIGWTRAMELDLEIDEILKRIQNNLFVIGTDLATPKAAVKPGDNVNRLPEGTHQYLEQAIDRMDEKLAPLRHFILPGGSEAASRLHIARSVCRRAEREAVTFAGVESINPEIIKYLNRLSDLLFTLARECNRLAGREDAPYNKR